MKIMPNVLLNDYGIRPAGKPDECFYCRQKVGDPHLETCVCVFKRVRLRFTVEIELNEAHYHDKESLEFHYNDGTFCASNLPDMIEKYCDELSEMGICLCGYVKCEYVKTIDETPCVKVKVPTE